jgi:hypothetical protein
MARKPELFISMDIEADGRVPGLSSMLSFGAAAFTLDKELIGSFSRNLRLLPEASPEPDTMAFWAKNQEAWLLARQDTMAPGVAMPEFTAWLAGVGQGHQPPLFVGYPAVYDFKWIDYYTVRFAGANPFGFKGCLDAQSFANGHLGGAFRDASRRAWPKDWSDDLPHTHVAVDDAIEQGAMIVNMIRAARGLPRIGGIVRLDLQDGVGG